MNYTHKRHTYGYIHIWKYKYTYTYVKLELNTSALSAHLWNTLKCFPDIFFNNKMIYFGLEQMSSGNGDMAIGTGLEHIKYLGIDVNVVDLRYWSQIIKLRHW